MAQNFFVGYIGKGSGSGTFVELTTTDYERQPVTFIPAVNGETQNRDAITFRASKAWLPATQDALFDASGNILLWWNTATAFTLLPGQSFTINAGAIQIFNTDIATSVLGAFAYASAAQFGIKPGGTPVTAAAAIQLSNGVLSVQSGSSSFAGNLVSSVGYQQNGSTVLDQQNLAQGSLAIGMGAGAAMPANSIFSTFVGYNAGHSFTGATGEATCIGTLAGQFLTTGNFCTALGENAMGREATPSSSTAIGNDAQRSYVSSGAGSNTTVGKSAQLTGGGNFNSVLGTSALAGNSSVVTLGGSATLNDTITLTFTGSFPGSPQSQAITITAGQTLTQMATAMAAAINGNSAIFNNAFIASQVVATGPQLTFLWPGTATTGFAIVITSSVTGSATETVTVSSPGATGDNNVAIGYQAMNGQYTLSSAFSNIAIGSSALTNISSGSANIAIGVGSGGAIGSGLQNVLAGLSSGAALTTSQGTVAIGAFALQTMTTATGTALGSSAGKNATGAGGTFVGSNSGLNIAAGGNNTAVGNNSLQGAAASSAAFNTAVGDSALQLVSSASQNTASGRLSGSKITSGGLNSIFGSGVASTTLQTGSGNILIGCDSTTDTAAAATSDTVTIKGRTGGIAIIAATAANTASPTTIIGGLVGYTPATGLTAHAGGGQASALLMAATTNHYSTVATAADSAKLPVTTIPGLQITVINDTATSMQVFGSGTDVINNVATATGIAVAGNKTAIFTSPVAGKWFGGTLT